jgi:hypothetical protein
MNNFKFAVESEGKEQTETFSELCNVLQVHGFKMVTINFREYRALFVNKL